MLSIITNSETMLRIIILLCSLLVVVRGQATNVNQCINSSGPLPLFTQVEGCVDPPCRLPQLQNVVFYIIFKSPRTVSNMTTLARATLSSIIEINVDYPLGEHAETCNFFTNTFCPILEGEVVQYRLQMFIERFFPVGTLATVEFRIVDNDRDQEPILCVRLPIQIIPALPALSNAGDQRDLPETPEIQ